VAHGCAFAHGGGAFPFTLARLDHGWKVRPEGPAAIPRPPREYARRLYFDLVALRKQLDIEKRVTFAGFRNDTARVISGMDVLVCSSSSEGFSLSVCQAMASGVPVVSTRCGGPEEILRDDVTGLLVPVAAAREIAVAIQRVADASRSALRDRLVSAARADVVARFSLPAMLDGYERVYASALGGATRSA